MAQKKTFRDLPCWVVAGIADFQQYRQSGLDTRMVRYSDAPRVSKPSPASHFVLWQQRRLSIFSLVFLCLIAILWLHRESDLLFQMSLSVIVFSFVIPDQPYNLIVLLIPTVWIEDNARRIAESGAVSQIVLAAVQVALILSWVANAVAAALWHTSPLGGSKAWTVTGAMILLSLGCVLAMMLVQLVFPGGSLAAKAGSHSPNVALI